jgi:hypothetical protein
VSRPRPFGVLSLPSACAATSRSTSTPDRDYAHRLGFDAGTLAGWSSDATGGERPLASWQVRADPEAVTAPNVVSMTATNQVSDDRFNLLWNRTLQFADGEIEVEVCADGGEID